LKIHWFLSGLIGALCLATPASAGNLASWRYDQTQNLLEFNTDEGVQPRAQLVSDPTRLVIDLPGTVMGQSPIDQSLNGAVQRIRIGQFDAQTTRIVVELAPGYTLDPQQVRFRGISPTQWTVQLPQLQVSTTAITATPPSAPPAAATVRPPADRPSNLSSGSTSAEGTGSPGSLGSPGSTGNTAAGSTATSSVTQVEGVQVTGDGLFVSTRGATPAVGIERSRDRRSIIVSIANARVSPQLLERERSVDRHGVSDFEVAQISEEPARVEIKLKVSRRGPDWQATPSELGGIILLPQTERAEVGRSPAPAAPAPAAPAPSVTSATSQSPAAIAPSAPSRTSLALPSARSASGTSAPVADSATQTATIRGVELDSSGSQLLIQSDRPVAYNAAWRSGLYQVTLSPARLADRVTGPQLGSGSPLLRVRLRQENNQTVILSIQPAAGVRFGSVNSVSPQLLSLAMERPQPLPQPAPAAQAQVPPRPSSTSPLPIIPNGRLIVVLDPGHGGSDVGAVGIDNIHEADIVLPVAQQVAGLLTQQGIQAVLTRNDDRDVELEPRVQMAEQLNATLFVSIHANSLSMDRPDVNGIETYYYNSGQGLAQVIQNSIVSSLGVNDRGIRSARFYVLRKTSMPSVLVEIGFVTGSEDQPHLADPGFRSQLATAIARGILQYIQQNSAGR
jgi:N-acetylmuramoyl-L-alanine amidase